MTEKIGRSVLEITVDDKQYKLALNRVDKQAKTTAKHVRSISQGVNLLVFKQFASGAIRALKGVTQAVAELGSRGAAVDDVSMAFRTLSENMGSTSSVMLGSLRAGVKGTLSDFELMQLANKALGAGLVKSSDDMEVLAAGARSLGKATGTDTKQAFETMMTSIASGRTAQLKQLGIFVDSKQATEDYAAAMGKTIAELNDADRAAALSAATIEALRDRLATIPPQAADFGEMLDFAKSQVKNFTDSIGVGIARSPVMIAGLQAMGNAFGNAFGGENAGQVDRITELVGEFGIGITHVAEGVVVAAQVMARAWSAVKTGVLAVETAIAGVVMALVAFVRGVAQMGTHIPVVGQHIKGFAEGAHSLELSMKGATESLAAQTAEASAGVFGHNALSEALGKVRTTIVGVRDAMVKAKGATVETGAAVSTVTTDLGTAGAAAAAKIEDTAAKVLETRRRLEQEIALVGLEGQQRRMLELQQAEVNELASLDRIKGMTLQQRTELEARVREKYAAMTAAAQEHEKTVVELAKEAGFSTRSALQQTANTAISLYNRMKQSGQYTAAELQRAWEAAEDAKRAASGETTKNQLKLGDTIMSGTTSLLQTLGAKNKAAAIAGAILATYQAIAKALASAPWPANLALAAGAAAAGWANVSRIRASDPGYATGTPRLDFADFGPEMSVRMHGPEAVIPQGSGHLLAGEIAAALPGNDDASLVELRAMREKLEDLPFTLTQAWKTAMVTA